jgi:hypothetical protein
MGVIFNINSNKKMGLNCKKIPISQRSITLSTKGKERSGKT